MNAGNRAHIIASLQGQIIRLEGFRSITNAAIDGGLGPIREAFVNGQLPVGCVHEFLSDRPEDTAPTCGFIAGLLSSLMGKHGASLWISASRTLFPPALKSFGIQPEHFVFIDLKKEKDVIWAMEEALKCSALTAVIGEIQELSFTASRRLQLATEQSQVTGFIVRKHLRKLSTTASVSRWKINSIISDPVDDLPGIGFPKWRVELLRVRNGKTGVWEIQWANGKFEPVYKPLSIDYQQKKVG